MPFDYACPHCGARMQVSEQLAGQRGMCNQCGQTIHYPGSVQGGAAVVAPQRSMLPLIILVLVVGGFLMMCVIGILIALLLPAVQAGREAARRTQCRNNLKQIAIALEGYHSSYGSYPPAYIADENGRPMHSWRVLILPFLEQQPLYAQYNFDEPWDGPNNQKLANQMPPQFRCPSANSPPGCTSYVGSLGPGRIFDPARTTNVRQVTDGTSNTIIVLETPNSQISWLDPLDGQAAGGQPPAPGSRQSGHPRGMNVAMADGSVQFVPDDLDPQILDALQTIDGKEQVGAEVLDSP